MNSSSSQRWNRQSTEPCVILITHSRITYSSTSNENGCVNHMHRCQSCCCLQSGRALLGKQFFKINVILMRFDSLLLPRWWGEIRTVRWADIVVDRRCASHWNSLRVLLHKTSRRDAPGEWNLNGTRDFSLLFAFSSRLWSRLTNLWLIMLSSMSIINHLLNEIAETMGKGKPSPQSNERSITKFFGVINETFSVTVQPLMNIRLLARKKAFSEQYNQHRWSVNWKGCRNQSLTSRFKTRFDGPEINLFCSLMFLGSRLPLCVDPTLVTWHSRHTVTWNQVTYNWEPRNKEKVFPSSLHETLVYGHFHEIISTENAEENINNAPKVHNHISMPRT
jgi:hypothetical protein